MLPHVRVWRPQGELSLPRRSGEEVRERLLAASSPPSVELFARLDGPGSSQDLPQFAAMATRLPRAEIDYGDPAWRWSEGLLRTPGICVDGPPITYRAVPASDPDAVEYYSPDFHERPLSATGTVPGQRPYFVCNILAMFGLRGVRIEADPMPAFYRGTGLGGSNLAHSAALILGSALSGTDLSLAQIYIAGTQLENYFGVELSDGHLEFGVSLTGGQESLTAFQGGVWDNVHVGALAGPYSVVSRELVSARSYAELEAHVGLANIGQRRGDGVRSADINNLWMSAWRTEEGACLHRKKPALAYRAAEALRSLDWAELASAVRSYRELRGRLAPAYLEGQEELGEMCEEAGAEYFPLGGGKGSCLIVSEAPDRLRQVLAAVDETADPDTGRTAMPLRVRERGVRCSDFAAVGAVEPVSPKTFEPSSELSQHQGAPSLA